MSDFDGINSTLLNPLGPSPLAWRSKLVQTKMDDAVVILSPIDAQLRFRTIFQRFVSVFSRAEHPLVIFVDDLQRLDPATLTLIEYLLLHPDTRHLLVIGAYRDNEVDSAHPLKLKLGDLRRAGARVDQIVLGPLSVDDIHQPLCDTLRRAPDEMRPFAELVHRRSSGNPFFVGQFLTSLAEERPNAFIAKAGK